MALELTDLELFWRQLGGTRHRVLLLDYDGTVAPFRVERDQAVPYDGVRDLLRAILAARQSRLVFISGRPVATLRPLLGLEPPPELWGTYGWERLLPCGSYTLDTAAIGAVTLGALAVVEQDLLAAGLAAWLERKPTSLAVHWRGLPEDAAAALHSQALAAWEGVGRHAGLVVEPFDGGVALSIPGRDKGYAVQQILAETPEPKAVAYLGDDLSDEPAFAAVNGSGLSVLVRSAQRPTAARAWLRPPDEVLAFLRRWHATCAAG